MNKKLRLFSAALGAMLLFCGGYLLVIENLVKNEFKELKQGTTDLTRIESLANYPFIQKDMVMYNAYLAAIYTSKEPGTLVENLHGILMESANPELRFRASLLLGNLLSNMTDGQNSQEGMMAAVGMYVQALKIKPDDLFAKLALEKILNQTKSAPSTRVKSKIKQGRTKNQNQQMSRSEGGKGEDI